MMQKLKDINFNHLYCFYEVARAQSLKLGAKEIGSAPSTVSEQIKKLEEKFELKLLSRSSQGLTLTSEGQKLYESAKLMFEESSRLLESFSDDTIGGYPVNIGIEETVSYDIATEFAGQYWDLYTEYGTVNTIRQAEHEELIESLRKGHIDWGISLRKPNRKQIQYDEIGSFEIVFCCAEELFKIFKNKRDILINIPFVENNIDKHLNKIIYQHLRKNKISPKEKVYSDHPEFVDKLCRRGRCVIFFPKNPLRKYQGLKTFQLEEKLRLPIYAIWKKSDESLVSIQKLKYLLSKKYSNLDRGYRDMRLQIKASHIPKELLKKSKN